MTWSLWNPIVVPILDMSYVCPNVNFPRFQGDVLIGCDGKDSRYAIYDLEKKEVIEHLELVVPTNGEPIWLTGMLGGIYDTATQNVNYKYRFLRTYIAPPAVSSKGEFFAVQDTQGWLNIGGQSIEIEFSIPPQPWYAPALSSCGPVWIDEHHDIWLYRIKGGKKENIAENGDYPRHIKTIDSWVYWVEEQHIVGWNCDSLERHEISSSAVDRLALFDQGFKKQKPLVCWSSWIDETYGTDILCSHKKRIQRLGHQTWPSIGADGKLLFREENGLFFVSLEESQRK